MEKAENFAVVIAPKADRPASFKDCSGIKAVFIRGKMVLVVQLGLEMLRHPDTAIVFIIAAQRLPDRAADPLCRFIGMDGNRGVSDAFVYGDRGNSRADFRRGIAQCAVSGKKYDRKYRH